MMHTDTNEENLGAYIKLLDAALQHEVCAGKEGKEGGREGGREGGWVGGWVWEEREGGRGGKERREGGRGRERRGGRGREGSLQAGVVLTGLPG